MDRRRLHADPADLALVRSRTDLEPRVAVVLGSGLGGLVERVGTASEFDFAEFPGYPAPSTGVSGHAGRLVLGKLGVAPSAVFVGRNHRYQGLSSFDVTWPVRLAHGLGATALVVTNAAGGVDPSLAPGEITSIRDHINLTGDNPLVGWPGPEGGTPFVPMGDAYDPGLRRIAQDEARQAGIVLREVVYAGLLGPSYETPAEVEYLRRVGAQTVGMSTVPEVIVARALGMRVLGLSLVTNVAGGVELSHDEVLRAGRDAARTMSDLLVGILARL